MTRLTVQKPAARRGADRPDALFRLCAALCLVLCAGCGSSPSPESAVPVATAAPVASAGAALPRNETTQAGNPFVMVLPPGASVEGVPAEKLDSLLGEWTVLTAVESGVSKDAFIGKSWVFDGKGVMKMDSGAENIVEGQYRLDESVKPAVFRGHSEYFPPQMGGYPVGIFIVEGKTLKFSFSPNEVMPTNFESNAENRYLVVTLARKI